MNIVENIAKIAVLIVVLAIIATAVQSPHTVPAINALGNAFSRSINAAQSGRK